MAPRSKSVAMRSILQDIVAVSASHGYPALPSTSFPATDMWPTFSLPPPSPIAACLEALGVAPSVAARLSAVYMSAASELRETSESKWRQAIRTCDQINCHFGMPSYQSQPLRVLALDMYQRVSQEMVKKICTSYEKHLRSSRLSSLVEIPRSLSLAPIRRQPRHTKHAVSLQDDCNSRPSPHSAAPPTQTVSSSTDLPMTFRYMPFTDTLRVSPCTLVGHMAPLDSKDRNITPVYIASDTRSDRQEQAYHSFPVRYIHSQGAASQELPSSSKHFFPDTQSGKVAMTAVADLSTVTARFAAVSIDKRTSDMSSSSCHMRQIVKTEEGGRPRTSTICNNDHVDGSQISLDPPPNRSSAPRRKLAPLPKRIKAEIDVGTKPHSPSPIITFQSLSHSPSNRCALASMLPATSTALRMPMAAIRRRKFAPLPCRQPSTPLTSLEPSSPSSIASSSPSVSRSLFSMSRTPSLVSLTSSRSNSPCISDNELDTPPSSPSLRGADLKTPHASVFPTDAIESPWSPKPLTFGVLNVTVKAEP